MRALKAFIRRWLIVIAAGSFAAPAAAQSVGSAAVVYSPPVPGTTGSPLMNPFLTGQWTVNGSLCATNQVVQGGSPTICTSTPTLTSLGILATTTESIENWRQTGFVNPSAVILGVPATTFGDVQANSSHGGLSITGFNDSNDSTDPVTIYGLSAVNGVGTPNVIGTGTASVGVYAFSVANGCCGRRSVTTKLFRVQHFQSVSEEPFTIMGNGSVWIAPGSQSGNENAIGVTTTPGLVLQNIRTPAAVGAQQYSPGFSLIGAGWKTNATAASQPVEVRQEVRPVQGAAAPTFTWNLLGRVNSGSWIDLFSVNSTGDSFTTGESYSTTTADNCLATSIGNTIVGGFRHFASHNFGLNTLGCGNLMSAPALTYTAISGDTSSATMTAPIYRYNAQTVAVGGGVVGFAGQWVEWQNNGTGVVRWCYTDQATCTAVVGVGTKRYLHDFSLAGAAAEIKETVINTTGTNQLNGVVTDSATAPTIASGGCTSPAVTHSNGTAAFLLTLGSSCTGVKTITLTMPAASHFWSCSGNNNTSDAQQAANVVAFRATTTTAVVVTNYSRTLGTQLDFTAADTLLVQCTGE